MYDYYITILSEYHIINEGVCNTYQNILEIKNELLMHNYNYKYLFQIERIDFCNIYKQNNVEVNTNQKNQNVMETLDLRAALYNNVGFVFRSRL